MKTKMDEGEMMKCPYCNYEINGESKFCERCGQEVSMQKRDSQTSTTYWEDYQTKTKKDFQSFQAKAEKEKAEETAQKHRAFAITIVVVLLIALAVGTSISRKNKVTSIIAEAETLYSSRDYEAAFDVINAGLAKYSKSEDLHQKAKAYEEAWIATTISEADAIAKNADYGHALEIVNVRLLTFPESEQLQKKVQEYTGKLICKTYSGLYDAGVKREFDLEIASCDENGHINAFFLFYDIDDPDTLLGKYAMVGDIVNTLNDGSMVASLKGTRWIVEPSGFYMIDFEITISADKTTITSEDYEIYGIANNYEDDSSQETDSDTGSKTIDTESPFAQDYWVIFTEGSRNDRVEASSINSLHSSDELHIVWQGSLYLNESSGSTECTQYFLDESDSWCEMGQWSRFSDNASNIIASNLDVFDSEGNLVVAGCAYSELDWSVIDDYR